MTAAVTTLRPLCDTRPRRGKHRDRLPLSVRLRAAGVAAVGHLRASAAAAFWPTVASAGVVVGLALFAVGVRL
jgi:hypothetical protein